MEGDNITVPDSPLRFNTKLLNLKWEKYKQCFVTLHKNGFMNISYSIKMIDNLIILRPYLLIPSAIEICSSSPFAEILRSK